MALVQITSKYFCAGVVTYRWDVQRAAPIVHYMVGWSLEEVRAYCKQKHWVCKIVKGENRS